MKNIVLGFYLVGVLAMGVGAWRGTVVGTPWVSALVVVTWPVSMPLLAAFGRGSDNAG